MNTKTQNNIMEAITELYEQKPHLSINDYYLNGEDVIVHFDTFGSGCMVDTVNNIAKTYRVEWVILPTWSIDGDVCVCFFGFGVE